MKNKWRILVALVLALSMLLVACGPKPETKEPEKGTETTEPAEQKDEPEKKEEEKETDKTEGEKKEEPAVEAGKGSVDGYALPHPQTVDQEGKGIEGGTLKIGLVMDSPWTGIFHQGLNTSAYDSDLQKPMLYFFKSGEDMNMKDSEFVKLSFDAEAKTATVKIDPKLTWSDGTPVTADDYEWPFLLI